LAKENETQTAPAKEGLGLLRRRLSRRGLENAETDGDSGPRKMSTLDLADIQGFILRGYRMPMLRHFLLTVGNPEQARRQLGRLVSGDLTVATPFDRMACKVKSWLSQQRIRHAKRRGDLLKPPMAGESLC
jgi:hypothetical protein